MNGLKPIKIFKIDFTQILNNNSVERPNKYNFSAVKK